MKFNTYARNGHGAVRRVLRGEIRAVGTEGVGTFEVLAVAYDVVDDYNTRFRRGVFNEGLEERLPQITWGHDWLDTLGRATGWREDDTGLWVKARLDMRRDPETKAPYNAKAYRAWDAMLPPDDGGPPTLEDVSVGFWRTADQLAEDGVTDIIKGDLDEIGVVLRGAVPGAKVLAVRSARTGEMVEVDSVVAIANKVAAGEISQAAADEALRLLSSPGTGATPPTADTGAGGEPDPLPELVAAEADADAALATLSDRGR